MTPRRLGKNHTGYSGDRIDISMVLNDCAQVGRIYGWQTEEVDVGHPLKLLFLTRRHSQQSSTKSAGPTCRIYLSAGIHGDEPAGPLAMRKLLQENGWPPEAELWLAPCLNPVGFLTNRRENLQGFDLNRQYLQPEATETLAHIGWLERQPSFDLCLCLHEDWEADGFYLYELNPDGRISLGETMLNAAARKCPLDRSNIIEGRPANNGLIRPNVDPLTRAQWPEAFFLLQRKTRLSYTLEAPSDFALDVRVQALAASVNTGLKNLADSRAAGCAA